jgi:hypothetical protein
VTGAVVIHAEMILAAGSSTWTVPAPATTSGRGWGIPPAAGEGNTPRRLHEFRDGAGFYGDAGGNFAFDENLHVVERFSLFDADTLLYQFEIDDPTAYTRPGSTDDDAVNRAPLRVACHEGTTRWRTC